MVRVMRVAASSAPRAMATPRESGFAAVRSYRSNVPNANAMKGNSLKMPFMFSHAPGMKAYTSAAANPMPAELLTWRA